MIIVINILIFCLTFITAVDSVKVNCLLENGKLVSSIASYVRGERGNAGVKILSNIRAKTYSISNGIVDFIGPKTKAIHIVSENITYKYFGTNPELKVGQAILAGDFIGKLDENFLVLGVEKNGKKVDARKYISCLGKD